MARYLSGQEPFVPGEAGKRYADFDQLMRRDEWFGRGDADETVSAEDAACPIPTSCCKCSTGGRPRLRTTTTMHGSARTRRSDARRGGNERVNTCSYRRQPKRYK